MALAQEGDHYQKIAAAQVAMMGHLPVGEQIAFAREHRLALPDAQKSPATVAAMVREMTPSDPPSATGGDRYES